MKQDRPESTNPNSRKFSPTGNKEAKTPPNGFETPTEPGWQTQSPQAPHATHGVDSDSAGQSTTTEAATKPVDLSSASRAANQEEKPSAPGSRSIRLVEEHPEPDPYVPGIRPDTQPVTEPEPRPRHSRPKNPPALKPKHGQADEGGTAFWDGCSLTLPRGVKPLKGTTITYNGADYHVAYRLSKKQKPYWKYALVGAIGAAIVGIIVFLSQPQPTAPLFGTVVNAETRQLVPEAMITLSNGSNAISNSAGSFIMASIPPGDYQMQITVPGFKEKTQVVHVPESGAALATVAVRPLFESEESKAEKEKQAAAKEQKRKTVYGAVELKTDFDDYIVYVDDRIQGKNVKKIERIKPGDHEITLEKPRYEAHRMAVSIRAHRTTHLAVKLADLKQKTTPRQRARKHYADGKEAVDQGLYQAAIRYFDDALAELPEFPEALQYRGWAYQKYGDPRRASADFEKAAQLYALANRYMEAILCTDYLIEIHPDNPVYHLKRGNYHSALNEFEQAIEDYKNAVDRDEKSLEYMLALAEGYFRAGEYKDAAKRFEKARKLASDPSDVYVRLILAYMYAGKDKDLEKRYKEFVQMVPQERLDELELDPEWKRVLQVIGPPAIDEQ